MSLPTFAPSMNPSYDYQESTELLVDMLDMRKPYRQARPLLLKEIRPSVSLRWKRAPDSVLYYIESFVRALNGSPGPFWWIPIDKVASPLAETPTLSQFSGGSLGAKTYYVVFTWYDSTYGETIKSVQGSIAVSANYYMRVAVPSFPSFVEGWRIYAHETSGQECLQATVTTSRTWDQSGALATGTATPPATNTLAVPKKWLLNGGVNKTKIAAGRWQIELNLSEQIV